MLKSVSPPSGGAEVRSKEAATSGSGPGTAPGAGPGPGTAPGAAPEERRRREDAQRKREDTGRRRHDPWRTAFFVGVVVALAGGVTWALLGSSFFVVRSFEVRGTAPVASARVVAAAGVKLGTPLVRVATGAVARRVERLTWVQSAKVRRSWPDKVIITTTGRTPVFAVRAGYGYDVIDKYGVVLRRTARVPADVLWLKKVSKPATDLRGSAIVYVAGTVARELPAWLRHRVVAVRAPVAARVILILRHGRTVVWGGAGRAREKAGALRVLLRTKATYYDVSDPRSALTGWPGT